MDELDGLVGSAESLLDGALEAPSMDCAIALERASKGFFVTEEALFLDSAEEIAQRSRMPRKTTKSPAGNRRSEARMFVKQGRRSLRAVRA